MARRATEQFNTEGNLSIYKTGALESPMANLQPTIMKRAPTES